MVDLNCDSNDYRNYDSRGENMDVGAPDNIPLVSVIVPIYNVAPWLRKCLDSLKGQTLKRIEVIMVEDGSSDESGEIAEEYVSDEWPVFRLIRHGENRGLSAARNTGIDEAKAEYLMFVDSDDWVDEKFCEIPYNVAVENQADIVIFQTFETTECGKIKQNKQADIPNGVISPETAIDIGNIVSWNKLYRKELFLQIKFPEGYVYEDKPTTPEIVYKANTIYSRDIRLYYHRHRKRSITQLMTEKYDRDHFEMYIQQYNKLIEFGYPEEKLKDGLWENALSYFGRAEQDDGLLRRVSSIIEGITDIPESFTYKEKVKLFAWKSNKRLYRKVYKIIRCIRKRMIIFMYKNY